MLFLSCIFPSGNQSCQIIERGPGRVEKHILRNAACQYFNLSCQWDEPVQRGDQLLPVVLFDREAIGDNKFYGR
jgi:hypothetical protein